MKTLVPRTGYRNKHTDGLPAKPCKIIILHKYFDHEEELRCEWTPYNEATDKDGYIMMHGYEPYHGYQGIARPLDLPMHSFHSWKQNDSEFVYYKMA